LIGPPSEIELLFRDPLRRVLRFLAAPLKELARELNVEVERFGLAWSPGPVAVRIRLETP